MSKYIDTIYRSCSQPPESGRSDAPGRLMLSRDAQPLIGRVVATLGEWRHRSRSRRLLGTLDDRTLSDIGVNRAIALYESSKPFWRQ